MTRLLGDSIHVLRYLTDIPYSLWCLANYIPNSLFICGISLFIFGICNSYTGAPEPNVGPGSAQILSISGFVNSKTNGENATVLFGFGCDLQKKGLQGKMPQFFQDFDMIPPQKRCLVFHILISQCHFDGPSKAHEPSAGPPEAKSPHDGPPEAQGPPDGPQGNCPPCPPLGGPEFFIVICDSLFIFAIRYSLFAIRYSLFAIRYSYSLFILVIHIRYSFALFEVFVSTNTFLCCNK